MNIKINRVGESPKLGFIQSEIEEACVWGEPGRGFGELRPDAYCGGGACCGDGRARPLEGWWGGGGEGGVGGGGAGEVGGGGGEGGESLLV